MLPLWSLLLAIGVEDVPNPRDRNSWVSDTAQIIPAESEARLDALLEQIHQATNAEIAVVTVEDVYGTPKGFATGLFNHWGIGSRERNDGVLFVMVMSERRLEVEVGYGLEDTLPDGWLGSMQTRSMVPRFKQRDFAGGLEVGVIELGKKLGVEGLPSAASVPASIVPVSTSTTRPVSPISTKPQPTRQTKTTQGHPANEDPTPWPWAGLLAISGLGLLGGSVRGARVLHHKRCKSCKTWRTVLPEDQEDAHLDAGQQSEEELGSIDYDVYVCGSCSSLSLMAKRAWFAGYSRCSACSYRTVKTSTTTLERATTSSEGMAEVTEHCHHCNHQSSRLRTIPRIQTSSSSRSNFGGGGGSSFGGGGSSRGGGSFGGGRSGGGGAGSSW